MHCTFSTLELVNYVGRLAVNIGCDKVEEFGAGASEWVERMVNGLTVRLRADEVGRFMRVLTGVYNDLAEMKGFAESDGEWF